VCRRLRTEPAFQDILLIAMTGYTQEAIPKEALAAGCDRCLLKPVDPDKFRAFLDTCAGRLETVGP
jgi:CheY-like chemotaxis protein